MRISDNSNVNDAPKLRGGRAVVFSVDKESLASLREALPGWEIEVVDGAIASSLMDEWNPRSADLLVIGVCENESEMLGLSRFLAFCSSCSSEFPSDDKAAEPLREIKETVGRANAPLLVLVRVGEESLVQAALRAGADSCLVLPIHHKEVRSMLSRANVHTESGRHTLNLHKAEPEDLWRDTGGEG